MGANRKNDKKKHKKRQRQLEQLYTEGTALLDDLVAEARDRAQQIRVDLAELGVRTVTEAEATLHATVEQAEAAVRTTIEHAEAQRDAIEATRAHVTGATDDVDAQIRAQIARIDTAVEAGIAQVEGLRPTTDARQLEQLVAASTAVLDDLVTDARDHAQRHTADLAELAARTRAEAEQADARLCTTVEEAEGAVRAVIEYAAGQRDAVEAACAQAIGVAVDVDAQIRDQIARIATAVEDELARLEGLQVTTDQQLSAATRRALLRIDTTIERREADDPAHTDAPRRLEELDSEPESDYETAQSFEEFDSEPESGYDTAQSFEEFERAFVAPPADTPTTSDNLTSVFWDGPPPPSSGPFAPDPAPAETSQFESFTDAEPSASSTGAPSPAAGAVTQATVTSTLRGGSPVTFDTSRAQLVTSLSQLRRAAADGWMRIEPVHRASQGQAVASLRLAVQDVIGGCEYHDVPGRASSGSRRPITVDIQELLHAVEVQQYGDDALSLTLDGDVTIGTVLVPSRSATVPILTGERRKVERIQLQPGGRDGLALDTLAGRFVLSSRVVSSLRSRRAYDVDLVMVGEQPCLSARVPGPTEDAIATIEIPLREDASALQEGAAERRETSESPVGQLVSALSTGSSPDELVGIIANGVGYARRRAASHPALPEAVIAGILRDGTDAMRSAAASNPSIPISAIELAVADEAPAVRAAVAANPNVAPALLFQLLRDDSAQVRVRVARNLALPPEMLVLLADDGDASVRAAVAAHESCPVETLVTLSGDTFPGVCANLATNPKCPVDLLERLLSIVPEVVLSNPRTPEHVLVAGAQVGSGALRAAVAANPSTPARELQTLARDPDRTVVRALATNPKAPASVRRRARRRSERANTSKRGTSKA